MSQTHPPVDEDAGAAALGVTENVYQELLRMLMQNDVAPGSRLIIDQLASELNVSSTPVRESLARLETQGLVHKERLRGYFAADILSREEFDDLWEFRLLVEPFGARQAAARVSRTARVRLRDELERIRSVRLDDDYPSKRAVREHDERLHDLVLELSGNQYARKAIAQVHAHNKLLRVRFTAVDGYHAIQEHAEIVETISAADPESAEEAMRTHLENAYTRLRQFFD